MHEEIPERAELRRMARIVIKETRRLFERCGFDGEWFDDRGRQRRAVEYLIDECEKEYGVEKGGEGEEQIGTE